MNSSSSSQQISRAPTRRRWRGLISSMVIGVALTAAVGAALAQPSEPAFRLIVNPGNAITALDRSFLAQAFLKKVGHWPDGQLIQPVDLDQASPIRRQWSRSVLSRSVEAVKIYWQQMIFSGRELPPPEMGTEADVINYVLARPGSVGYVSAGANLRGARVVTVR
jgi:hypothetical protein